MIQLYEINPSVDQREIGYAFPQVKILPTDGWDVFEETSVGNFPIEGVVSFRPHFPRLGLKNRAKCTDLLSTNIAGCYLLMISEKLYRILCSQLVDTHQCFVEEIETSKVKVPYLFLAMPFPRDEDLIDWPNSLFYDKNDPKKTSLA